MATGQNDKKTRKTSSKGKGATSERGAEEPDKSAPSPDADSPDREEDALVLRKPQDLSEHAGGGEDMKIDGEPDVESDSPDADAARLAESPDDAPATQLGAERYVLAGFFGATIVATYVLGRMLHSVWLYLSNKDWFSQTLPTIAAVSDDDKSTYSTVIGALISVILVLRTYRKPDVRTWADEVASELAKVKWPTKKEVSNSVVVVIAASAVATVYLALLDRLWGFITDIVYGGGS
jgi:preprotein translocase subunit SecE